MDFFIDGRGEGEESRRDVDAREGLRARKGEVKSWRRDGERG